MIESIFLIGKGVQERGINVSPRRSATKGKQRKEEFIAKIVFDVEAGTISAEPVRYSQELESEYRWVGHVQRAAKDPVERLTVSKIEYLSGYKELGKKRMQSSIINIRRRIARLKEQSDRTSHEIAELDRQLELIERVFLQRPPEQLDNEIRQALSSAGLDPRTVRLYTVCLRHKNELIELAKSEGYGEFLRMTGENPETKIAPSEGICYFCGYKGRVLADPAFDVSSLLKIYVTDKKGFSSGVSEDSKAWARTFAVCSICRMTLLNGWRFINQQLRSNNIKGTVTYLIPRLEVPVSPESLMRWAEKVRASYDAVSTYEGLMRFEKLMEERSHAEDGPMWYSLTVVFSKTGSGSHFSLVGVIQDVPVTRLSELRIEMLELERWAQALLGGDQRNFDIGLNALAEVFPLDADRYRVPKDPKPLLELYDSLLTGIPYPRDQIIRRALLLARIHRYDSYEGFSIKLPDKKRSAGARDLALCLGMLKYNLVSILLSDMNALHPNDSGDAHSEAGRWTPVEQPEERQLPEEVIEWFSRAKYQGHQKALFLLGYLIAEIGRAQYNKGDEKKSVLDKIDFYGMSKEKVIELANIVLKSLRDYRLLGSNEKIYGIMKILLDMHLDGLNRPSENTYYVLSGYAFRTYQIIINARQRSGDGGDADAE